jgi:hypothetical protein
MYRFIVHFALFQTLLLGVGSLNALAESPSGATVLDLSGPLSTHEQPLHAYSARSSSTNDWEARYRSGLKVAQKGTSIGKTGAKVMGAGLVLSVVGIYVGFSGGNFNENPLFIGGLALTGGGAAAAYWGAAQAAYGTTVAHRALARKGIVHPFCGSCVLTFVALAPIPITVWAGVPLSYMFSDAKRHSLDNKYWAYRKGTARSRVQPTLRLSPIATRSGPGLGLAGEF